MNILLSTDNNYVMPTGVLMHSICINNHEQVIFYVIVNETFLENNVKSLTYIAHRYNKEINFYVLTEDAAKEFPMGRQNMPQHVSIICYYRLFLAKVLPSDVHKIIYLDGDMIVRHSLQDLWNVDLEEYAVGVVNDQDEKIHIRTQRLPYPMETGYFNSGMLVVNVDYWRKYDCFGQFVSYVREHGESVIWQDQDILNTVLYDKKRWLPVTYNFQTGFLRDKDKCQYVDDIYEEIGKVIHDPAIIHYTEDKPWWLYSYNPYLKVWRYYKSKSQWKDQKLEGDNPDSIKHHITMFLFRHGLMVKKTGRISSILKK